MGGSEGAGRRLVGTGAPNGHRNRAEKGPVEDRAKRGGVSHRSLDHAAVSAHVLYSSFALNWFHELFYAIQTDSESVGHASAVSRPRPGYWSAIVDALGPVFVADACDARCDQRCV